MVRILVERDKLESIKYLAECLLEKDGKRSFNESENENAQTLYGNTYLLDKKEREVINFLNGNPGSTKEDVVRGLKGKFSRVTVFDAIDRLFEKGLIVNKGKGRNQLYVKHEEEILSIQENLGAFQSFYSELIDEMISIFQLKLSEKENQKDERALIDLLSQIIKLYKFICITYIISDIFLWHKRSLDNDILHAKFELFFNTMKETHNNLCEMLTKVGIEQKSGVEIVYTMLYNGEWSFSVEELSSMLKSFNKYGLGNYFEAVIDAIWVLSYPILPLIDPFYKKHYRNGTLSDWRNLFKASNTLHYSPITPQSLVPEEY